MRYTGWDRHLLASRATVVRLATVNIPCPVDDVERLILVEVPVWGMNAPGPITALITSSAPPLSAAVRFRHLERATFARTPVVETADLE